LSQGKLLFCRNDGEYWTGRILKPDETFQVTVISKVKDENMVKTYPSRLTGWKGGLSGEVGCRYYIMLYWLIREILFLSGKSQGILKSEKWKVKRLQPCKLCKRRRFFLKLLPGELKLSFIIFSYLFLNR